MCDEDLINNLQLRFKDITLTDCKAFIRNSWADRDNLHMAATDDADVYMGTVSLKNIDRAAKNAEFAIAFRRCALGTGISRYAMKEILRYGLEELELEQIYWYVSMENTRALRFYDKCGYSRVTPEALNLPASSLVDAMPNMLYYAVTAVQFEE